TMTGATSVTEDDVLFFIDATLWEFQNVVSSWIDNCQSCDIFKAYTCPAICTEVPAEYEAPIL
ncbi:MAG: hypothetical protein ACK55I_34170, partial [bacterium]